MDVVIKQIQKRDFAAARKFAIKGMHLDWYASPGLEMYLYSQYFWCLEISKATRAMGAYLDDALVGVLLVDMKDQPKIFQSYWCRLYVKIASFIINIGYKDVSGIYDAANKEMLAAYQARQLTNGELNFFAVNPAIKGKGLGTLLLKELERLEKGKRIYLFTDSGSTYQFYSRRGFDEVGRKEVSLEVHGKTVPLTCLLFSKLL